MAELDPEGCEATIRLTAFETTTCWAARPHPGEPHMAMLCEPCRECGGYDEHRSDCSLIEDEGEVHAAQHWYSWKDPVPTEVPLEEGSAWREKYLA